MPKILITAGRIRSILADAYTDADAVAALRRHRIRYSYSTEGGQLHIRIPSRSGVIAVYQAGRPLTSAAVPVPFHMPTYTDD